MGFHWYENWTGESLFENVKKVQEAYPKKIYGRL
jgi:hypothetical protein